MRTRLLLILSVLCLIGGCSVRKDPNNTDLNHWTDQDHQGALKEIPGKTADDLLRVSRVIDLETTSESLIAFPFDLCISGGEVFVASRNNEIKVFDMEGKYQRSIGRLGDGPGEYRAVASLFPHGSDGIGIYDWSNLRLTVFSRTGEYRTSAVLGMPGMEGVRSVLFIDGSYFIHVPSSPAHGYHVVKLDSTMAEAGAYVEADKRYTGYQDRYLFNGGVVTDSAGTCLYEANSYSHGVRRIDLATGSVTEVPIGHPPFYVQMPDLPDPASMEETLSLFQNGTNTYNLFRVASRYLMLEYHAALGKGRVKVHYLLYDIETGDSITIPGGEAHPTFADGMHLYNLLYYSKNSKEREEDMVRNPSLVIYDFSLEGL